MEHLDATFMVRVLPAWHVNVRKRQVKAPKVHVADSGILHALLGIDDARALERHPVVGASWEGFALGQTVRALGAAWRRCAFWGTHGGAELDLLVDGRLGVAFKQAEAPRLARSMRSALEALELEELLVVHAGDQAYPLADRIRAFPLSRVGELRVEPGG